jgi:hypothetical protein
MSTLAREDLLWRFGKVDLATLERGLDRAVTACSVSDAMG